MFLTYSHQSSEGLEKKYMFINADNNYPGKESDNLYHVKLLKPKIYSFWGAV